MISTIYKLSLTILSIGTISFIKINAQDTGMYNSETTGRRRMMSKEQCISKCFTLHDHNKQEFKQCVIDHCEKQDKRRLLSTELLQEDCLSCTAYFKECTGLCDGQLGNNCQEKCNRALHVCAHENCI